MWQWILGCLNKGRGDEMAAQMAKCIPMGLPPQSQDLMCWFKKWNPEKLTLCRPTRYKHNLSNGLDFKKLKN